MATSDPTQAAPIPPQNLDAEEAVLGALLLAGQHGPEKSAQVLTAVQETGLGRDVFYRCDRNGAVFEAIVEVVGRGEPADVLLVAEELVMRDALETIGGQTRLYELAACAVAMSNAPHHARLVVNAARQREADEIADAIKAAGANGGLEAQPELRQRIQAWLDSEEQAGVGPSHRLCFRAGPEFVEQEIERRPSLLGAESDVVLPAAGLVILGGEGGAGKSTLTLHALAHFATGEPWLGIPIDHPLRIGVIENEGPKQPYIEKLSRFADDWQGPDFLDHCYFLDAPWGRFTLADSGLRAELRGFVTDQELELVIAGPLGRLGVEGVGSPEETRAFLELLVDVGCQRDVAWWLLHHVKKGKHRSIVEALSGDWGGHPDLILGVEQEEGARRTKLTFGKIRWGDQGRRPLLLDWLPPEGGFGYSVVDVDAAVEEGEANRRRVLDAIASGRQTTAEIADVTGLVPRTVRRHITTLAAAGEITLEEGPNNSYIASQAEKSAEEPVPPEELAWR